MDHPVQWSADIMSQSRGVCRGQVQPSLCEMLGQDREGCKAECLTLEVQVSCDYKWFHPTLYKYLLSQVPSLQMIGKVL